MATGDVYLQTKDLEAPSYSMRAPQLGTTIMAAQYNGGVVIAADSRTTTGSYIVDRVSDKLTPLADYIYCCRSGSAADTQMMAEIAYYKLYANQLQMGEQPKVYTAAHNLMNLCYKYRADIMAGLIVAGWDKYEGGQVYVIPLGGLLNRQPIAIGGSGSTYLYGYVDAHYKPDMPEKDCMEFCKSAVSLAIARDGSSGGVVRMARINQEGITRFLFKGDVLEKCGEDWF